MLAESSPNCCYDLHKTLLTCSLTFLSHQQITLPDRLAITTVPFPEHLAYFKAQYN